MRAIRCSSQRVDFDFTVEKHTTATEVFAGKKMEPFSRARGRQFTHNCEQPAMVGHSAGSAVRYEKTHTSQKRAWVGHPFNKSDTPEQAVGKSKRQIPCGMKRSRNDKE